MKAHNQQNDSHADQGTYDEIRLQTRRMNRRNSVYIADECAPEGLAIYLQSFALD